MLATFHGLRQQAEKDTKEPYYCLSDFVAPKVRPAERNSYPRFAVSTFRGCSTCDCGSRHYSTPRSHAPAFSTSFSGFGKCSGGRENCRHVSDHASAVCAQDTGVGDYLGLFANAAFGLEPIVQKYKAANDDYSYIMAEALADRCTSPHALSSTRTGKVRHVSGAQRASAAAAYVGLSRVHEASAQRLPKLYRSR